MINNYYVIGVCHFVAPLAECKDLRRSQQEVPTKVFARFNRLQYRVLRIFQRARNSTLFSP